jgi:hypothetical protein
MLRFYFFVVFWYLRTESVVSCPPCMRSLLARELPLGIVAANLLCPVYLVWWGVQFTRTFLVR